MQAGKLRHRVTFERPGLIQDPGSGDMVPGWELVWEKVPASVEPLSARDLIAAQAAQSQASGRIRIRYRPGVLPTMRILHRGTVYEIQGQPMPDAVSGLEYLTILVAGGVSDG
jgi:SPP1 family predicted phage head-tail adaptor